MGKDKRTLIRDINYIKDSYLSDTKTHRVLALICEALLYLLKKDK